MGAVASNARFHLRAEFRRMTAHEKAPVTALVMQRNGPGAEEGLWRSRPMDNDTLFPDVARVQPKAVKGADLRMMTSTKSGCCPRCHTWIKKGSLIVRLDDPERPWSEDYGKSCWRTGGYWYYNGQPVSMHHRWYVHWRCYVDVMVWESACVYCGADHDMTVDHIIPRRYGGSDQPKNLVPACRPCNSRKGTLPPFLVGMTRAELGRWLLARGWVREGKNGWRRPQNPATFTAAVACRISAYGQKAVMA